MLIHSNPFVGKGGGRISLPGTARPPSSRSVMAVIAVAAALAAASSAMVAGGLDAAYADGHHLPLVSTAVINGTAITSGAPGGDNTFGRAVANLGDLDGDGSAEFAMGAPGSSACACTGEIYILFTSADGTIRNTAVVNGDTPNGPASLGTGDRFGRSLAGLGDLDGDGVPDMAVGATGHITGGVGTGDVYVIFLNANGTVKRTAEINAQTPNGPASLAAEDRFGASVANMGDLDGDGVIEIAAGATGHYQSGVATGDVYVMFMNADGTVKRTAEINGDTPNGPSTLGANDHFGYSLANVGDIDGDRLADMAVGAPGDASRAVDTGDLYLIFMNADASVKRTVQINGDTPNFPSLAPGASLGEGVAGMGDLDDDGTGDIAVGAPGHFTDPSGTGDLYVLFMNADGTVKRTAAINAQTPNGPSLMAGDHFGTSVTNIGDRSFDGIPDLAVGTYGDDTVHLILLNADGSVGLTVELAGRSIVPSSTVATDHFGWSAASIGDLDGDGTSDMVVGATGRHVGGTDTGYMYVLFLNSDGSVRDTARIDGQTPNGPSLAAGDRFGSSVAGIGDLDGDGAPDIAAGAPGHVLGSDSTGSVYVLFLNADGTVKRTAQIGGDTPNGPSLAANDRFGESVAGIGDLDGDGIDDLAAGAPGHATRGSDTGNLHVIFLNADGTVKRTAMIDGETPNGPSLAAGDRFGWSVAGIGDLDGDSVTELAAGAPGHATRGSDTGDLHVIFLNADGTVKRTAMIDADTPNGPSGLMAGDRFGASVAGVGDLDGDGSVHVAVGAPGPVVGPAGTGSVHLLSLNSDGTVKGTDIIDSQTPNGPPALMAGDRFGLSVAWMGDLDGDGGAEIAIGAPNSAFVYVASAPASEPAPAPANPDMRLVSTSMINGTAITSGAPGGDNTFGIASATLGDLDGDGVAEFAVGAPGSSACACTGEVYIVFANAAGVVQRTAVINGDTPNGPASLGSGDRFGRSLASLGDLDGDGVPDMAVGSTGHITGGVGTGDLYVLFMNADGTVKRTVEINAQTPNGPASLAQDDRFGASVANMGDLDGDGVIEIAAGATGHYQAGAGTGDVYVMFMNADGTVKRTAEINGGTPNGPPSLGANDQFGYSLANVGDIDGDGVTDMAVGASGDPNEIVDTGDLYVILLNADASVKRTVQINGDTPNVPSLALGASFGEGVAGIGDLDGDRVMEIAVGVPGHFTDPSGTGDLYVLFMNADASVKRTAVINAQTPGGPSLMAGDHFGTSVANIGDSNSDGIHDLAVGTYGDDTVHIVLLNADGSAQFTIALNGRTIVPSSTVASDHFGWSAASIGDLDGDGTSDMVVGATGRHVGGTDTGYMYVLFLNSDGSVRDTARIDGQTPNGPSLAAGDRFGSSVAGIGDLDGDGAPDIAAGAPGHVLGSDSTGDVHVIFLNADGTVKRTAQIGGDTPNGPSLAANDRFGESVAGIGDLDGDGIDDLAAGAPGHATRGSDTGDLHVIFLNADGTVKRTAQIGGDTPNGPSLAAGDRFGWSVAGIGDLDGDGTPDIAAGAPGHATRGSDTGDLHVMFMNSDGTVKRTAMVGDGTPNGPSGLMAGDRFGASAAGVGDLDGDGAADIAVGAPGPVIGPAGTGTAYVVFMNADGTVKDTARIGAQTPNGPSGLMAGDRFGASLAGMGDLDGDGGAEIAMGAPNSASVYVASAPAPAPAPANPDMRLVSTSMINGTAITSGAPGGDNTFGIASATLGDLDGDGVAEFAVGAPGSSACACTGEVYIVFANAAGVVQRTAVINGDTPNVPELGTGDRFGRSLASLGDLDGDGVPDMAVGSTGHISGGVGTGDVYVIFLNADGTVKRTAEINAQTPNGPASLAQDDRFGASVANMGDLDGDGVIEIAAGATGHYQAGAGTGDVYVMFMNADGTVKRTAEINGGTPNGPPSLGANDNFGLSVANIGDMDGDGVTDMAVGAPGDPNEIVDTGDLYLIFMNADASVKRTVQINGDTPNVPSLALGASFGEGVAGIGDLDGDRVMEIAVGVPGHFTDPSGTGDLYVLFMNADGTVKRTVQINAQTPGGPSLVAGDHFGMSVANIGDSNSDGIHDLAVGTYGDDTVHIVLLNADGSAQFTIALNGRTIVPSSTVASDHFGWSAASIGDLDGDGTSDMVVGATGRHVGGTDTGHMYVLFLNSDGSVRDTARIDGQTPNGPSLAAGDRFGSSVAGIGDLDGDGAVDIVAGAPGHVLGSDSTGDVHVIFLNADGTVKRTAQIGGDTPNGPSLAANDRFGESVAGIGDLDGDGIDDLAAGAPGHATRGSDTGDLHVIFLNADGTVKRTAQIGGDTPNGPSLAAGDRFGWSVAGIGDLDGDGARDIAAGAPGHATRGSDTGDLHVIFLNADGTVKRTAQIGDGTPNGPSGLMAGDRFGASAAGVGDLDGDGAADIAVGAPGPVIGPAGTGTAYVVFMNADGTVKDTARIGAQTPNGPSGLMAGDRFGASLAGMGDLDGDGGAEIAMGAPNSASVYVAFTTPGLAPPPTAPGTVSGTVYSDTNNNAMMDAGEPGIGGVTVVLVDGAGTVSSAVTGSGGAYSFANAAPGPVLVQAAPLPQMHKPSAGTSTYTYGILPAQGGLAVDFALYPVTPSAAAAVVGKVYGDANGNIVFDGADAGLAGVPVFVVDFLTLTQRTALTDAGGDYSVSGVLPDSVLVQIAPVPAGFLPQTGQEAYRYLTLSEGATAAVDFVLSPVAPQDMASVGGIVYQDNNANGVRDAGEPGIPDSLVFVFELLTAQQQTAFTDADGEYSFAGVLPDTVLVQYMPKHESITPTAPAGGFAYLDLGAGQSATQDFANSGMLASPVDTLTAMAYSEDRIDLQWDEPATPAGSDPNSIVGYRVDVEYPPGTGFEPIALDTFTGLTWFYNTGLLSGTEYSYRVFPITAAGTSSASNVATAVTDGPASTALSDREASWLADNPVIRVAYDPAWPPFEYVNDGGDLDGLAAQYLAAFEGFTGADFEQAGSTSWSDALASVRDGRADILTMIVDTEGRHEFLEFTAPHTVVPAEMITLGTGGVSAGDLAGLRVATLADDALESWLDESRPDVEYNSFANTAAAIGALADGSMDVYLGSWAVASYVADAGGIAGLSSSGPVGFEYSLSVGIHRDNPMLKSIIQKALDSIPDEQRQRMLDAVTG